jgi:phosphatidylethanolamine/phosphatidyl-N-methylethanolamine N-methyltransferase
MMQRPARPHRPRKLPPGAEPNFLLRFLDNPRRTGAVAPSGPFLAREMARAIDPRRPGLVVELGPGTGPVTKALLARGVPRERLVLVEYDSQFCKALAQKFPLVRVLRGDAYALGRTLDALKGEHVAAVVSSLPLLNEPPERRLALLEDAFALMGPDGVFVQFTYGLAAPVPRELCAAQYDVTRGAPIWRNLPPASVWTYRRAAEAAAPEVKVMRLIDHAEKFAKLKASEFGRQGDKVIDMLKREVAALKRPPARKGR